MYLPVWAPLSYEEAYSMIRSLRAYKIIQGTRGQKGVNEDKFAEIIVRLSTLLRFATEIKEMDINPLLATEKAVIAVDARIRNRKNRTIFSIHWDIFSIIQLLFCLHFD